MFAAVWVMVCGFLERDFPRLQCRQCFSSLAILASTLCLKNDTDVALYNFDADQTILIIFGRDVAERACYQTVICHPTSPNYCLCTLVNPVSMCTNVVILMGKCMWPYGPSCLVDFIH